MPNIPENIPPRTIPEGELSEHTENDDWYDYKDLSDGESEDDYDQSEFDDDNEILEIMKFSEDDY